MCRLLTQTLLVVDLIGADNKVWYRWKEMNDTATYAFNLSQCTGCSDVSQDNWHLTLITVVTLPLIDVLISILGMLGNSLVLLAIAINTNFRSVPDFLIFSLSLADLLVTAIYLPLFVIHIICYQELRENATYSMIKSFVGHLALLASIGSILGITIDRLTAIRWPLRYPKLVTKKFAFIFIFVAWLISAVFASSYSFFEPSHFFLLGYCMTLLLATILMYSYIFKVAHAQRKKIVAMRYRDQEDPNPKLSTDNQDERKATKTLKERKAAKTFAIVIGVFVITWIPLLVYPLSISRSKSWFYEGFLWAETFSLWNSSINPYIYFARSKRYRRMALQMLGVRQWRRPITRPSRVGMETSKGTTTKS